MRKALACTCAKQWLAHVKSNGVRMAMARVNGACAKQLGEHAQGNCVAETSEILVSREFFFIFTSRSRSRAVSISLSLLEKEWRDFIFHFSLLEKSESYRYFTLFSREKRVKLGPGYNLTSIFVPNCISKDSQISSKHKPQNIGQISVLKSWPTPMPHCPMSAPTFSIKIS